MIVDDRERPSGVPELLEGLGVRVEYLMLTVGDYVVSRECAVERKESRDFLNSLFQGRLFDQAYRLGEAYRVPVMIVEGDLQQAMESLSNPKAVWGALSSLSLGYGLHVFYTQDSAQTADLIYTLARRERFLKPTGPVVFAKPKGKTIAEVQLGVVSSLPGVGEKFADRILSRFVSVRRVFAASAAELSTIRGFGRVRAARVASFLDSSYNPGGRLASQVRLDEEELSGADSEPV